jgi:hypothetical protein
MITEIDVLPKVRVDKDIIDLPDQFEMKSQHDVPSSRLGQSCQRIPVHSYV